MADYKQYGSWVKMKLTVPQFILPTLDLIDNQSVGKLIREALRSAGRPGVLALKTLMKTDLMKSDQSTGAAERAVTMKYGRSKTRPNVFFLLIGVDKNHFELHTPVVPEGQATKLRKGSARGRGLFATQTRRLRNKTFKSKQVFSRFRNDRRISKMKVLKRKPGKYFHLIDRGFNHHAGGQSKAYLFINRLINTVSANVQSVFEERLRNLVVPIIKQELVRKIVRVLR